MPAAHTHFKISLCSLPSDNGNRWSKLTDVAPISFRLDSHRILLVSLPIAAKSGVRHAPVVGTYRIQVEGGVALENFAEHAVVQILRCLAAITRARHGAFFAASGGFKIQALRVAGSFGGDIDNAIDGIGSPQTRPRSANDL